MRRLAMVFGLVLLGCGGAPTLGLRATDPPLPKLEAGVVRADETLRGKDGVELYARSYRPESGEPKAVVVIQHGLKDHGDRYAPFSQSLVARGYGVYAIDLRGHGRSAGERAAVARFDDYVDDLAMYVEHVRAKEPGKPIFVFGHSAGGALVTLWAIERKPNVAGIMLSAAALENDAPASQIAAVAITDSLSPGAPVFELPNKGFSRDSAVVEDMTRDPLIYQDPATAHLAWEVLEAIRRVWAHPEALTVPLLAMHGTDDTITAPSGTRNLVARAGSKDKTLRLYEGYAHVLLSEPGHERVESDIVGWLEAHSATDPSAARPPVTDENTPVARELRGDRSSHTAIIDFDGRIERSFLPAGNGQLGGDGGFRIREGFGRVGYLLGVDVRLGGLAGFRWLMDGHLVGFGARTGGYHVGVTTGISGRGFDGVNNVRIPAELTLAAPGPGPIGLFLRGSFAWKLNDGGPGTGAAGIADEAAAFVGARLGRDRRYWGDVHAAGGPLFALTYTRIDTVDIFGLALGLDLWGSN